MEEWTSWDEDAPTSVKIEGGNGSVATQQNSLEQLEPDYFKDMTPTIRKTQKVRGRFVLLEFRMLPRSSVKLESIIVSIRKPVYHFVFSKIK